MKFSPQRVLTVIAAICLLIAAIARGEYLLGSLGTLGFGFLAASAVALTLNLMQKWQKYSVASKIVTFTFVAVVAYTLIFPKNMWPDYHYFAQTRQWQRAANQLQTTLAAETEFRDVRVRYYALHTAKGEFLDVRGDVPDLNAYEQLVDRIESMDTWFVVWGVTIDGNEPPEPAN